MITFPFISQTAASFTSDCLGKSCAVTFAGRCWQVYKNRLNPSSVIPALVSSILEYRILLTALVFAGALIITRLVIKASDLYDLTQIKKLVKETYAFSKQQNPYLRPSIMIAALIFARSLPILSMTAAFVTGVQAGLVMDITQDQNSL